MPKNEKEKVITVTISGGCVSDVKGIPKGIVVRIVDFDTEGSDPDRLQRFPDGMAAVSTWGK